MNRPYRFASNYPLQRVVAKGEFGKGEIAFASETTLAEWDQILRYVAFGGSRFVFGSPGQADEPDAILL